MIRLMQLAQLLRLRPVPPRTVPAEAPPRPAIGAGPVRRPAQYVTRLDGLIRIDEDGITVLPFATGQSWPKGQHPYPEVTTVGWWQHAITQTDLTALPIARPYTQPYPALPESDEDWWAA